MTEWFEEGLDQEHLDHAKAKGWNKPLSPEVARAMVQAHRAAEKHMGSMARLPTDANDPSYKAMYDRIVGMGAPKAVEEYKLDDVRFGDGNSLDPADQKFVAEFSLAHKLPLQVARGLAASLAGRADALADEEAASWTLARQANQSALRQVWGVDYDRNAFTASRAVEAFPQGVRDAIDTLSAPDHVQIMQALLGYGRAMTEAAMLKGGRASGSGSESMDGMTGDQAHERLRNLQQDPKWVSDALTKGTDANRTWEQLTSVIARARIGG